jgi:hypothetical protein
MRYVCEQLGIPLEAEQALVDLYNSFRHRNSSSISGLVESDDYCTSIHDAGEDVTPHSPLACHERSRSGQHTSMRSYDSLASAALIPTDQPSGAPNRACYWRRRAC